jgi:hypothetical protein
MSEDGEGTVGKLMRLLGSAVYSARREEPMDWNDMGEAEDLLEDLGYYENYEVGDE